MLGSRLPDFELQGIFGDRTYTYNPSSFKGRWLILFFYPADFSFVCPTELRGFQKRLEDFRNAGADIAAVSTDGIESHRQWATELGGIGFPLLSDPGKDACRAFAVLDEAAGRAHRATFIVSPEGKIAYMVVSPMNVGRSVEETYRVLLALQTGRLCPVDWQPGEETLDG